MPGKNKTPLIGWHSADPALKPWIQAEAERRGQTVREFLDEVLAWIWRVAEGRAHDCPGQALSLTGSDRRIIAKAREVAALRTTAALCERYGVTDGGSARAEALGEAQFLLEELAARLERAHG